MSKSDDLVRYLFKLVRVCGLMLVALELGFTRPRTYALPFSSCARVESRSQKMPLMMLPVPLAIVLARLLL